MGEKSSFLDRVSILCHMGVKKPYFMKSSWSQVKFCSEISSSNRPRFLFFRSNIFGWGGGGHENF